MNKQILPEQKKRVETGVIQFGDDWPGVFIRGDNAFYYAMNIRQALQDSKLDPLVEVALKGLLDTLEASNTMNEPG